MGEWHTALTSREWAVVSWMGIALVAILAKPNLRRSVGQVLRSLLQPLIVASIVTACAYIGACVWLMHRYEIWAVDNLKTTILWAVTFAFVTMSRLNRLHDPAFYRQTFREAFSLTVLVVFITEFYTLPFLAEFILLPILVFFTMISEVSKGDPRHKIVKDFSGCVSGLIAAAYVLYSVYRTFTDPASLLTFDNGRDVVVPVALTALFLPFLYVFGIWARYDEVFAVLHVWVPDRGLRAFAKRKVLLRFGPDVKTLDRWRHIVVTTKPATREAIMQSIVEAWSMKTRDLYPLEVSPEHGWEPVQATQMLAEYYLTTLDYKPIGDGEWSASSPLFELGSVSENWRNNVAYYISGTQFAATELILKLNINVPHEARYAEEHFIVVGFGLIESAIGFEAVEVVKDELARLHPFTGKSDSAHIALVRDDWKGGVIEGGYDWTLKLKRGGT